MNPAHSLIMLQHELLMSLDVSDEPKKILISFAMRTLKTLNLRALYVLEKDNAEIGIEVSTHQIPQASTPIEEHDFLKKYIDGDAPNKNEFLELIQTQRGYWYCFALKDLGYLLFERSTKRFDQTLIYALSAPMSRFAQTYIDRKQFLLNERNRLYIKTISEHLQSEKGKLEHVLRSIQDGVLVVHESGWINFANEAAYQLLGLPETDQLDEHFKNYFNILETETERRMNAEIVGFCMEHDSWTQAKPVILRPHTGKDVVVILKVKSMLEPPQNDMPAQRFFVCSFHNITENYAMERRLKWQATHDPLTSCLNRHGFQEQLEQYIESDRENERGVLLCLDLDRFKYVNDIGGHVAGDALLQQLSALMQQELGDLDFLGRVGGDEFCVLLRDCSCERGLKVAESIRRQIDRLRFKWETNIFSVGVSVGASAIYQIDKDADAILLRTDEACMVSKENGRNQVTAVDKPSASGSAQANTGQSKNLQYLNRALSDNDDDCRFILYKQDIRSLSPETQAGHQEVLLRILKDGKILAPNSFLPAAERSGKVADLDLWVLSNTLDYLSYNKEHRLNVNLSGVTLSNKKVCDRIYDLIKAYPVEALHLCLEITETSAIINLAKCIAFMEKLLKLGVTFALDDFGTGVSSFSYLKNMPVEYLKIDGSFIQDICNNKIDEIVVQSIVAAARAMDIRTVAEYVSDQAILDKVTELGIDFVQGFCLNEPEPLIRSSKIKLGKKHKLLVPY
ncbi:EAL domain-containing protein [Leucothrix mucor]|uniref:EAL domain-containing protein n=1 Tax=Leucothrix mucor TaxID=45248 RepID=UPI0003B777BF|nr:EAL domain-containing protein [Leucothrix mucor]